MLRSFLALFFLLMAPVFFYRCEPNLFTELVLTKPECHWIANDFIFRDGTFDEPNVVSFESAAIEIQWFTDILAARRSASTLMASNDARVMQQIDSIRITSSVDLDSDSLQAGTNLAGKLFTVVHYPNLQLRDYERGVQQFNEYLRNLRRSNHQFYLYLRPVQLPTNQPFDLRFTFFINDNTTQTCTCDWVILN